MTPKDFHVYEIFEYSDGGPNDRGVMVAEDIIATDERGAIVKYGVHSHDIGFYSAKIIAWDVEDWFKKEIQVREVELEDMKNRKEEWLGSFI